MSTQLPSRAQCSIQSLPRHRKKCLPVRLATLNVGTLTARSNDLVQMMKKRKADVCCVQETRWSGSKARSLIDGFKVYYHGTPSKRYGVGIILSFRLTALVTEVLRLSDRLMALRIEGKGLRCLVVSAYAPQTGCSEAEKDDFWKALFDLVAACPPEYHVLVGGDLNGHVGDLAGGSQAHGGHGFGVRDEDGARILDWTAALDLCIANTWFPKRDSHLVTYSSGGRKTQIDFWCVRRSSLKLVVDCKVIPETVTEQHLPLYLDIRLPAVGRARRGAFFSRIKWWKAQKDPEFPTILAESLDAVKISGDVESDWNALSAAITQTASDCLGRTTPGSLLIDRQTWFWSKAVQDAVKSKRKAFLVWRESHNQADKESYLKAKRAARITVGKAKQDFYKSLYAALDTKEGENKVYRLARSRQVASADIKQVLYVKDRHGRTLFEPQAVCNRWREHFDQIANEEFAHPPIPLGCPVAGPVLPISEDEVRQALISAKSGKACGPDDIPTVAWRLAGDAGVKSLTVLLNSVVDNLQVPSAWLRSTTVPVFKKRGDVLECGSYRPIRLLVHTVKVLERIIDQRLRTVTDITVNQCGFRSGVGTIDAIFALRQLLEKHREWNQPVFSAFLDLEKAFDRVPHAAIWWALRDHQVPEAYISWIKCLYTAASSSVRCPMGSSDPFLVTVGVHQGSALSPLLFNLVMDSVTRDLQNSPPWTLLYADDVVLCDTSVSSLETTVQQWKDRLQLYGLRLNISKTECMTSLPPGSSVVDNNVSVDGTPLLQSTAFKYLGSVLSSDGDSNEDVNARVASAWCKWRSVSGVLCDKSMPIKLKSRIYRTMVRPVALYGSECRATTAACANRFHCMEMNMLRWSLGVTRLDKVPNDTIRMVYGVRPVGEKMVENRLRWYGHVRRSAPGSVIDSAWKLAVVGRRGQGRPRMRWYQDNICRDMMKVGVSDEDVLDRTGWRQKIRAADPPTFGRINA